MAEGGTLAGATGALGPPALGGGAPGGPLGAPATAFGSYFCSID